MNRFLLAVAMIFGVSVSALALPGSAAPREHRPTRLHASISLRPPTLAVQRRSSHDAPGYVFVASKGGATQGPEIFDDRGRPVWFKPVGGGDEADDLRVQNYQGTPVLTWWQGTALITAYHAVPYDLTAVGGPATGQAIDGVVQEIDIATGQVLFEWHSLDHVPLTASYQPVASPYAYF